MRNILLLLFIIAITFAACRKKKSDNIDPNNSQTDSTKLVVASNVHLVDSTKTILNTDAALLNNGVYQFKGNNLTGLKTGDILIGTSNGGYLRKINSITTVGTTTTLNTSQAYLPDIFESGEINFSVSTDNLKLSGSSGNSVLKTNSSDLIAFSRSGLTVTGSVNFNPNVQFISKRNPGELLPHYVYVGFNNATITGNLTMSLNASQGAKLTGDDVIFTKSVPLEILVAGLPVEITATLEVHAIYSGSVQQSVSRQVSFTHTNVIDAAIIYNNGSFDFPYKSTANETQNISSFTGNASFNATLAIMPVISFKVYDIIGPYFSPALNGEITGSLNTSSLDWNFGVSAWLSGSFGGQLDIFGLTKTVSSPTFKTKPIKYQTPASIITYAGDKQDGDVNTQLPKPIDVLVTDSEDKPQAKVPVYFTVSSGDGSVTDSIVFTDATGHAQTKWKVGASPNDQKLSVKALGGDGSLVANAPLIITANANYHIGDRAFGGIVAYVDNGGKHGFVVDSVDLGTNVTQTQVYNQGAGSILLPALNADSLSSGSYLTTILTALSPPNKIALVCKNYKSNTYSGWFLPSVYQLNLVMLANNVLKIPGNLYYTSNVSLIGQISGLGGLYSIDFNTGSENITFPRNGANIRAIKMF